MPHFSPFSFLARHKRAKRVPGLARVVHGEQENDHKQINGGIREGSGTQEFIRNEFDESLDLRPMRLLRGDIEIALESIDQRTTTHQRSSEREIHCTQFWGVVVVNYAPSMRPPIHMLHI